MSDQPRDKGFMKEFLLEKLEEHLTTDSEFKEIKEKAPKPKSSSKATKPQKWISLRGTPETLFAVLLARSLSLLYAYMRADILQCDSCEQIVGTDNCVSHLSLLKPKSTPDRIVDILPTLERYVATLKSFKNGSFESHRLEKEKFLGKAELAALESLVDEYQLMNTLVSPNSLNGFLAWIKRYDQGNALSIARNKETKLFGFCHKHTLLIGDVVALGNGAFAWKKKNTELFEEMKKERETDYYINNFMEMCKLAGAEFTAKIEEWKKEHGVKTEAKPSSGSGSHLSEGAKNALKKLAKKVSGGSSDKGK